MTNKRRDTGKTNKEKYDAEYLEKYGMTYYQYIGSRGGRAKSEKPKGFAYLKATGQIDRIAQAGRVGGRLSRPGKHE